MAATSAVRLRVVTPTSAGTRLERAVLRLAVDGLVRAPVAALAGRASCLVAGRPIRSSGRSLRLVARARAVVSRRAAAPTRLRAELRVAPPLMGIRTRAVGLPRMGRSTVCLIKARRLARAVGLPRTGRFTASPITAPRPTRLAEAARAGTA